MDPGLYATSGRTDGSRGSYLAPSEDGKVDTTGAGKPWMSVLVGAGGRRREFGSRTGLGPPPRLGLVPGRVSLLCGGRNR